jgi:formamidopyrimidine-DNA glycosylase
MPELPEVETTARDLNDLIVGLKICNVWTSYDSEYFYGKEQIKDPKYFKKFKKEISGKNILSVTRRAKNVLINLEDNKTILIHMKMTGHLLFGKYKKVQKEWVANEDGPLTDKFNGWIRVVFTLSNKKHLVLSDLRKFAKVMLIDSNYGFEEFGPEPLEKNFSYTIFKERILKKKNGRIKNVLMDQTLISGVGNIYSDEALWISKIHPETPPKDIPETKFKKLFKSVLEVLRKGIDLKGDSTSDYRNPSGLPGEFHHHHKVYRLKGEKCLRPNCKGVISRVVVGGRSAHFCPVCQKKDLDIQ